VFRTGAESRRRIKSTRKKKFRPLKEKGGTKTTQKRPARPPPKGDQNWGTGSKGRTDQRKEKKRESRAEGAGQVIAADAGKKKSKDDQDEIRKEGMSFTPRLVKTHMSGNSKKRVQEPVSRIKLTRKKGKAARVGQG